MEISNQHKHNITINFNPFPIKHSLDSKTMRTCERTILFNVHFNEWSAFNEKLEKHIENLNRRLNDRSTELNTVRAIEENFPLPEIKPHIAEALKTYWNNLIFDPNFWERNFGALREECAEALLAITHNAVSAISSRLLNIFITLKNLQPGAEKINYLINASFKGGSNDSPSVNHPTLLNKMIQNREQNDSPSTLSGSESKVSNQTLSKKTPQVREQNTPLKVGGSDSKVSNQTLSKKTAEGCEQREVLSNSEINEKNHLGIPHSVFYVIASICSFVAGWLFSKVTIRSTTNSTKNSSLPKGSENNPFLPEEAPTEENSSFKTTLKFYLDKEENAVSSNLEYNERPYPLITKKKLPHRTHGFGHS